MLTYIRKIYEIFDLDVEKITRNKSTLPGTRLIPSGRFNGSAM